jgi:hypothetical protein
MLKHYVSSDIAPRVTYLFLAAAAFVFVAMLLMTGMHPQSHHRSIFGLTLAYSDIVFDDRNAKP